MTTPISELLATATQTTELAGEFLRSRSPKRTKLPTNKTTKKTAVKANFGLLPRTTPILCHNCGCVSRITRWGTAYPDLRCPTCHNKPTRLLRDNYRYITE